MKQRLAGANPAQRAGHPLLDEPTAGLDPEVALEVRGLIAQLSAEGRTILLCTHLLGEAESLCHRISVLRTRLLAVGSPTELRQQLFRRTTTIELAGDGTTPETVAAGLRSLPWVVSIEVGRGILAVELQDTDLHGPALVQAVLNAGGRIRSVIEKKTGRCVPQPGTRTRRRQDVNRRASRHHHQEAVLSRDVNSIYSLRFFLLIIAEAVVAWLRLPAMPSLNRLSSEPQAGTAVPAVADLVH